MCVYCVCSCVTQTVIGSHPLTTGCHNSAWRYRISNYWKLGAQHSWAEHVRTHTHTFMHGHTHLPTNTTTSFIRVHSPLWHTHTHARVGTHLCVCAHTDVELIKRFPEGSQERQATVGTWRNLPLWPEKTLWRWSGNETIGKGNMLLFRWPTSTQNYINDGWDHWQIVPIGSIWTVLPLQLQNSVWCYMKAHTNSKIIWKTCSEKDQTISGRLPLSAMGVEMWELKAVLAPKSIILESNINLLQALMWLLNVSSYEENVCWGQLCVTKFCINNKKYADWAILYTGRAL